MAVVKVAGSMRSLVRTSFFTGAQLTSFHAGINAKTPNMKKLLKVAEDLENNFNLIEQNIKEVQTAGQTSEVCLVQNETTLLRVLRKGRREIVQVRVWNWESLTSDPGVSLELLQLHQLIRKTASHLFHLTAPPQAMLTGLVLPRKVPFFTSKTKLDRNTQNMVLLTGYRPQDLARAVVTAANHTTMLVASADIADGHFLGGAAMLEATYGAIDEIQSLWYTQNVKQVVAKARSEGFTIFGIDQTQQGRGLVFEADPGKVARRRSAKKALFLPAPPAGLSEECRALCDVVVTSRSEIPMPAHLFFDLVLKAPLPKEA